MVIKDKSTYNAETSPARAIIFVLFIKITLLFLTEKRAFFAFLSVVLQVFSENLYLFCIAIIYLL
jgi:hypothetical protein